MPHVLRSDEVLSTYELVIDGRFVGSVSRGFAQFLCLLLQPRDVEIKEDELVIQL